MLKRLQKDPLVIKETRISSIQGLVDLMDEALEDVTNLSGPSLILYGENDEVIPKKPIANLFKEISKRGKNNFRVGLYENGYHLLSRDLQAHVVMKDIAAWISNSNDLLPSKADQRNISILLGN